MSFRYSGYGPRRPRHDVTAAAGFPVEVERSAAKEPGPIEAELVDLSRGGYQLRTSVPLAKGESITLKLYDEKSGLRLALPGTVRWTRSRDGATWLQGCRTSSPIEWETLGELFLSEILATDAR